MTTDADQAALVGRGNYFARPGFFDCDCNTGVMRNPAGRRVLALTDDFIVGLRDALDVECGPAAAAVLATCGRTYGEGFGRQLDTELSQFHGAPLKEFAMAMFTTCLVEALSRHGFGLARLDTSRHAEGLLVVEVANPIHARLVQEPTARPQDHFMAGFLAGVFSHLAGRPLDCLQTECQAAGAPASRFVIGLAERLSQVAEIASAGGAHDRVLASLAAVRA